jgi:hypothetical protein
MMTTNALPEAKTFQFSIRKPRWKSEHTSRVISIQPTNGNLVKSETAQGKDISNQQGHSRGKPKPHLPCSSHGARERERVLVSDGSARVERISTAPPCSSRVERISTLPLCSTRVERITTTPLCSRETRVERISTLEHKSRTNIDCAKP